MKGRNSSFGDVFQNGPRIRDLVQIGNEDKIVIFCATFKSFVNPIALPVLTRPTRLTNLRKLINLYIYNSIGEIGEALSIFLEIKRLGSAGMRCSGLYKHKLIDNILENVQANLKKIELIEERETVVDHIYASPLYFARIVASSLMPKSYPGKSRTN